MSTAELEIEHVFIKLLTTEANQWKYREDIKSEEQLWENVRGHIWRNNKASLHDKNLTDNEFELLKVEFQRLTASPFQAAQWLRGENGVASILIEREDNSKVNLELFRNKDIAGGTSSYEVVHQIVPDTETKMRSDVTLLINGLPIIHIELKNEAAKDGYVQAYEQIQRYALSGFFDGIYATTQIFIVSNKTATKYFARPSENTEDAYKKMKKFLFNWRTEKNEPINDLYEFTKEVLKIPAAHELVSQYTILVDDQKKQRYLMVLRPYQIHAIKKIREQASNHEGGFIWHATGSGKTITSFVATKLLAQNAIGVDRTVMIVDRTDLDSQTKDEFTKFASEYHTGQASGKGPANTLIVGIDNQKQLTQNLLSKKNNNTIIVTTIQKLSAAIQIPKTSDGKEVSKELQKEAKEKIKKKFEKLWNEHIVFIVDEAHRAVSDKQMKEIKKYLPNSTWFGLTGTPIFDENKKQENGENARTTSQQYGKRSDGTELPNGGLLHAYTTKNAMEDGSVLDFQVEYRTLLEEDERQDAIKKLIGDSKKIPEETIEQEKLIPNELYEQEKYIQAMLKIIFKRRSLIKKFKVVNGWPTMSAILTTSSIAQAKRIYHKLMELKAEGNLFSGKDYLEKEQLIDPDFPRVAITYSNGSDQLTKTENDKELEEIIKDYGKMYGSTYATEKLYNLNVTKRLARKEAQYQKDGQWLDLVIVVDRMLTGFDAPTIQTLYVDREMSYQKLLQAFSRTNRTYSEKDKGMIVTFRKPEVMKENVSAAFRLFSNEEQDWNKLLPKEYEVLREEFEEQRKLFDEANYNLSQNPTDLKLKIEKIKAFQKLEKIHQFAIGYDDYEEDEKTYKDFENHLSDYEGEINNLKGEIKDELSDDEDILNLEELLKDVEFSSQLDVRSKELINSYYINNLLKDIQTHKEFAEKKLAKELKDKPDFIRAGYEEVVNELKKSPEKDAESVKYDVFNALQLAEIRDVAVTYKLPEESLISSFQAYNGTSETIPYVAELADSIGLTKEEFEALKNEKYRRRTKVFEAEWRDKIENLLLKLKDEM
ncbi:MAG: HsdR family type I site-specific deoxyribonuclease [Streptococcaceae bacterium]|jgi:type I restriction enzyme R subunit|nr:HsdR family type I site-specific deoxyribonuclease [Streptococcaceae bacterium]